MFDANMRWVAKDHVFMAEIVHVDRESPLWDFGIRKGDVVYCKMLGEGHVNPLVRFYNDKATLELKPYPENRDEEDYPYHTQVVYAGNVDGSDFVNEDVKQEAMRVIDHRTNLGLPV